MPRVFRRRPTTGLPTDAFVYRAGEPPDPRATKIGGLPLWPREKEWPRGEGGRPLAFYAQVCFSD